MEHPVRNESIEYNDNRLALYCAQQGKCAITGRPLEIGDIHCHHKVRRADGGNDSYSNLILVCRDAHILLHAMWESTIEYLIKKACRMFRGQGLPVANVCAPSRQARLKAPIPPEA